MNGTTNNNNNERVATCTEEYHTYRPAHFRMITLWRREVKMRQAVRQRHVNTQTDVNEIHEYQLPRQTALQ